MTKKKVVILVAGVLIAATFIYGSIRYERWKTERVSFAAPAAIAALQTDDVVRVTEGEWVVFEPVKTASDKALIFYPGGECDERGYAELLRAIAAGGVTVVLVPMPFYLAVLAPDKAEGVQAAFPDIRRWAIAGHSLGGAMAAQYVYEHPDELDGLLLWDAYPPEESDLSGRDLAITMIHRADSAGALPDYYSPYLPLLPAQTNFVAVPGGTHMNFGNFILAPRALQWDREHQLSEPIPLAAQHQQIIAATLDFMAGL